MHVTAGLEAESYDRSYSDAQLLRRSAVYFRPHRRLVSSIALAVVLISLAATLTPVLIARGIDALVGQRELQLLLALAALVSVLGALGWLLNLARVQLSARAVGDVVLALRQDAFRALMRHDLSFYDQHAAGRIVSRVTSDTQDFATLLTLGVDLLSQLVLIVLVAGVMLVVNLQLALVTLAIGPIMVVVALVFRRVARRAMQQAQRVQATLNATIHESIGGIAVAKNFRQEHSLYQDFQQANALSYRVQLRRHVVFGSIHPLTHALSGTAVAVLIMAGGALVLDGSVSVGDWYLFVQSLSLFISPVVMVASFWGQFQQGLAACERVFALIDAEPAVVQLAQEPAGTLSGRITFEQLRFRYSYMGDPPASAAPIPSPSPTRGEGSSPSPVSRSADPVPRLSNTGREGSSPSPVSRSADPAPRSSEGQAGAVAPMQRGVPGAILPRDPLDGEPAAGASELAQAGPAWVLDGFDLEIPAGQTLAVVGHTGAGKSSLIKLIMRFYAFQGGRLLVDGRDIRALDLASYRRQLGLVPQSPFLFSGSVLDNIRYGRPEASDAEVEAAARSLGDGSWVDALPGGLRGDVGERGARLSFGQRQLVALVRVLLQDPRILLLDEATASVDPLTEAQIQQGLAAVLRGRTSIVIAHRLSTVRGADRIIVLHHGQIIEEGDHQRLLEQGGHYAELYNTYFRHQSLSYQPWA